ncbi:MAG: APC family permease [Deltaproteobacteria bacterium]|nr:APC family permease [Deltaproteobacteria bacterium]
MPISTPPDASQQAPHDPFGDPARRLGLLETTGVGISAIVGGGILVLAGTVFAATGPSAIIAFAINGLIAFLTALTFAELATAFPENGGAYTYAKKVLSMRIAFAVGWILWFAYIVAGVLYALGFAEYAMAAVVRLWRTFLGEPPGALLTRTATVTVAIAITSAYALSLIRKSSGGAQWATVGKLVVFAILIISGVWVFFQRPLSATTQHLSPFLSSGTFGLVQAMGFSFIALQGFEVIAAVAGEVKQPDRTLPRAMILSLATGLAVYLPLLFLITTVGVREGDSIVEMSRHHPETVMAIAASNYLGTTGYWLVMIAALLSTLSALQANILAASRVALSMARDSTLPNVLAQTHPRRGTPLMAIYATTLALVVILLLIPDLAAAGAAASLIFLISFALAHGTAWLARLRSDETVLVAGHYRAPAFPAIPAIGGLACVAMAIFQAVAVPAAGGITLVWLALGGILFVAIFARRAHVADAFAEAADPDLVRSRGRQPLVLVPVANPASAPALVALARALAPPSVGRVLLLSVVRQPDGEAPESSTITRAINRAQDVLHEALTRSIEAGHTPEALMTIAPTPWDEIIRVATSYRCENLLLGLHRLDEPAEDREKEGPPRPPTAADGPPLPASALPEMHQEDALEHILNQVESDVSILRAMPHWDLTTVRRVVIPIGGKGTQDELRARLLGSLSRVASPTIAFVRVLPSTATKAQVRNARHDLAKVAEIEAPSRAELTVLCRDDVVESLVEQAAHADLMILGLPRVRGRKLFGKLALRVAREARCPTLMLSREG